MSCMTLCRFRAVYLNLQKHLPVTYRTQVASIRKRATHAIDEEPVEDEAEAMEKEVSKLRDVSNLTEYQKHKLNRQLPDANLWTRTPYFQTRKFRRRMYAYYGASSGIDPGIMWPSEEELAMMIEDEREYQPTFHQMVEEAKAKRAEEVQKERDREKLVDKQMAAMPGLIKKFKAAQQKTDESQHKFDKEQQERLLDEFRVTFGFAVDATNKKFKEFRMQRLEIEKEERRLKSKQMKREAKEQKVEEMLKKASEEKKG